jgi:hypothetical protein
VKDVVHVYTRIPPATTHAIEKVKELTEIVKQLPQVAFITEHLLHAGMYTRTVRLPPRTICTAVLITPATVLITLGDLDVWSNEELTHVRGYNVIPGGAGRKIAFVTYSEVCMSMLFPCTAKTVDEAQRQFTNEHELLPPLSDVEKHRTLITGE